MAITDASRADVPAPLDGVPPPAPAPPVPAPLPVPDPVPDDVRPPGTLPTDPCGDPPMPMAPGLVTAPSKPVDPAAAPLEDSPGLLDAFSVAGLAVLPPGGAMILRLGIDAAGRPRAELFGVEEVSISDEGASASVIVKADKDLIGSISEKRNCHNIRAWITMETKIDKCNGVYFIVRSRELSS
jgi:hypothetical protein